MLVIAAQITGKEAKETYILQNTAAKEGSDQVVAAENTYEDVKIAAREAVHWHT